MNENRSLPAFVLVAVLAAALLLGFAMPGAAAAVPPPKIAKAFDFFHAKQQSSGGFGDAGSLAMDLANTTPWTMLAIAAGGEKVTDWDVSGKDPLDYMQASDLEARARGSVNAPAFYAKVMLAYGAIGRNGLIWSAGTPRIDLLNKMNLYRADDGHYSLATSGDRSQADVSTTTWALLALRAANQAQSSELVTAAAAWLVAAQNPDHGWSFTTSTGDADNLGSTIDQTAAVVQALVAAGQNASSPAVASGLAWIKDHQRSDGGFPSLPSNPRSNAESTAWAVQAAYATKNGGQAWVKTALSYLGTLQRSNGAFAHSSSSGGDSTMMTTTQVTVALGGEAFPFVDSGGPASAFRPKVSSFKPSDGARFTTTNDVAVSAAYADTRNGTGVDKGAVRIFVDGVNRTGKAKIGSSTVKLSLIDVPNGTHSVEIRVRDRAGNSRSVKHTFTVSVSTSSGGGSGPAPPTTPAAATRRPRPRRPRRPPCTPPRRRRRAPQAHQGPRQTPGP